jgi:hypothetical protein
MQIFLTQGRIAHIDDTDWPLVCGSRWHLHVSKRRGKPTNYYARSTIKKRKVLLHRFLLKAKAHQEVDHLDGDGLNCRRSNIECVKPIVNKKRRDKIACAMPAGVSCEMIYSGPLAGSDGASEPFDAVPF